MKPQHTFRVAAFCAVGFLSLAMAHAANVTMATVPVGDAGNANDSVTNTGLVGGLGAVAYNFNIGKYDVTITQYTAFLNAVAKSDPNNLYNPSMATDLNVAGINRSGASGGYVYSVIGSGQRPVTYVSWYDAARFTNWLTNGQTSGGTETGVYTLTGVTSVASLPANHSALAGSGTKWFLPTENEWYKATFYKGGSTNAGYWQFPFKSDTQPAANATPGGSNSANFRNASNSNRYAVTQSSVYSLSQNYLTDVGLYSTASSPYGSFDMGGDVTQWNESLLDSPSRGIRGCDWNSSANFMIDHFRQEADPTYESNGLGFRVAALNLPLPEPSTLTLFALGAIGVWFASRRRRLGS